MKPINEMSINECLWVICNPMEASTQYTSTEILKQLANRIHELTRWIPVSERLPTEADADQHGYVLVRDADNESSGETYHSMVQWDNVGKFPHFYTITDWKRIDL
jgi:hypothetical protein